MCQLLLYGSGQILNQVKAIGYLLGAGRPTVGSVGIDTITISGDDFYHAMFLQPFLKGSGGAVRQQIDHYPPLQIHQDRPLTAVALPPSPLIHPQHADGSWGCMEAGGPLDVAQQSVIANRETQPPAQSLPGTAAQSIANLLDHFTEASGFSGMLVGHPVQTLAEDPSLAVWIPTAPTPDSYSQFHRSAL